MITDNPKEAANVLRNGGVVVFPTETVFGIGASAFDFAACSRIYAIKRRPMDNPLIIHLASIHDIPLIAHLADRYYPLLHAFCPGPLTIILPKKVPDLFTAGLETVAIRIPKLPLARAMLAEAGIPIAAPSANLSGKPSITRLHDAVVQFQNSVDLILQGPDCTIGIESTVIDLSGPIPVYLRPGAISFEAIQSFIPELQRLSGDHSSSQPISPGLKYRHYAPCCEVILIDTPNQFLPSATLSVSGQIGFQFAQKSALDITISNNEEYSRNLYAFFIDCDSRGLKYAYCQRPKSDSFEEALLNRILKAATAQD